MNAVVRRRPLPVWTYLLVSVAIWILGLAVVSRKQTGLIHERLHPGPGAKDGMSSLQLLYTSPWLAHYAVAWLDRSRLHWSDRVPLPAQIIGLIGFAASNTLAIWAMAVNPFFSSVVRIQRERGQRVITNGPYQYVRHPGYLAGIGMAIFSPLALDSWLSYIPAVFTLPFVLRRTMMEETLLRDELEGYREYAVKVRYRWLPGVW